MKHNVAKVIYTYTLINTAAGSQTELEIIKIINDTLYAYSDLHDHCGSSVRPVVINNGERRLELHFPIRTPKDKLYPYSRLYRLLEALKFCRIYYDNEFTEINIDIDLSSCKTPWVIKRNANSFFKHPNAVMVSPDPAEHFVSTFMYDSVKAVLEYFVIGEPTNVANYIKHINFCKKSKMGLVEFRKYMDEVNNINWNHILIAYKVDVEGYPTTLFDNKEFEHIDTLVDRAYLAHDFNSSNGQSLIKDAIVHEII